MGRSLTGSRCRSAARSRSRRPVAARAVATSHGGRGAEQSRHGVGLHRAAVRTEVAAVRRPGGRVRAVRSRLRRAAGRRQGGGGPGLRRVRRARGRGTGHARRVRAGSRFATTEAGGRSSEHGVSIVGAGLSGFGRQPGVSGREMAVDAIRGAARRRAGGPTCRWRSVAATAPAWPTPWWPSSASPASRSRTSRTAARPAAAPSSRRSTRSGPAPPRSPWRSVSTSTRAARSTRSPRTGACPRGTARPA